MGDHNTTSATNEQARLDFIRHLLDDVKAFDQLLNEGKIESGIIRIGAEQEFCLVNENWRPAANALSILETINDPHFTTELAKYNLEINLDPFELTTDAFTKLETQLTELMNAAKKAAAAYDTKIVLTGILPSISINEIGLNFMTPNPRYFALNEMLKKLRGTDFRMHLTGVDELSINHDSVMFEACNTSFQMHLQIEPHDFISSYNWAQAISGPILGLCVNSPLLLGRELWNETRIALFQQSIDTRNDSFALKDQQPRVTFGDEWVKGTVVDIFKNEISRYKIILSKDIQENSLEELKNGRIPKLPALNLHNSSIYRWNRACYGVGGGKAHVRIENRYIPAGPSLLDEMANFAFWVGLMTGRPAEYDVIADKMDFKDAKSNFIKAARTGSESIMSWMGEDIALNELVLNKLLPIAYSGLQKMNIDTADINRFLGVIEQRVKGQTGAQWITRSYRSLRKEMKQDDALLALTKSIYENQKENKPVHQWQTPTTPPLVHTAASNVGHIMTTQLVTAFMNDTAELTLQIMEWKKIHHLPVVDHDETLVGLLTWTHMQNFKKRNMVDSLAVRVHDIMEKSVLTVETSTNIQKAIKLMKKNEIGCLPVTQNKHLVGIITIDDVLKFDNE